MKQILSTTEKVNLINYLLKTNSNFIFELGGTIFPDSSRGQYLDNQRRSWLNSRLKGELKLINFYKNKVDPSLIEQFPVLIKDVNLWHKCLLSVGISPYNTVYGKREYFVLDGYSRQKHFAIEADYDSTHDIQYDAARDLYLMKEYQLVTCRIFGYGFNSEQDKESRQYLKYIFSYRPNWIGQFDYSDLIVLRYLQQFPGLYNLFDPDGFYDTNPPAELVREYYNLCNIIGRKS